ncbi:MAG: haloacid dehalogenase-like hydrolase [Chloroflexi bacterium]|jgi:phosphoserine phosphatase|nr:haloacid dehalogenase-like hydrolase [Chloroflexota bacterium]
MVVDPATTRVTFAADPGRPTVVADLEGTCTAGETWRGLGRYLSAHGRRRAYRWFLLPRLAAVPLVRLGLVDEQAFRNRWVRDLARLLAGEDEAALARIAAAIVDQELWPRRKPDVVAELAAAAAGGARLVLASGTYQPVLEAFAARLADEIGSDAVVALGTPLELRDGRATGRLAEPIGTGPRKAQRVRALVAGAPVSVAYGDSAADLPLLELAVEAVAVSPDRTLGRAARARGWRVLGDVGPAG